MSRYASGRDRVRRHVRSIKFYQVVAGCRGAPRSVAACRGWPGRSAKSLKATVSVCSVKSAALAHGREMAAVSQERETRERGLLNDAGSCGESSQMGGGRSANRRLAGLPKAIEAADITGYLVRHGGCFSLLLSESVGQSTSQPLSAFRFSLCRERFGGAFGKVAAIRSSTALRGTRVRRDQFRLIQCCPITNGAYVQASCVHERDEKALPSGREIAAS
jgi:hypothetical protein